MAATEPIATAAELKKARRWVWTMVAVGALAFVAGLRGHPPVVFVHAEQEERQSKAAQNPEKPKSPPPEEQEAGETERPTMLPWLYLMKP